MNVLIVEDHKRINENISLFLKDKKFTPDSCFDGESALSKLWKNSYDLIILDVNLPNKTGIEVAVEIRKKGLNLPIIMLTALDSVKNKVEGLDSGADDYLVKPFSLEELFARIKALLRRKDILIENKFFWGEWSLDLNLRGVYRKGSEIHLSLKEFDLLFFLLKNKGKVFSKIDILEYVWGGGDSLFLSETVEVHVSYLRKKMGKDVIKTARGVGYFIE